MSFLFFSDLVTQIAFNMVMYTLGLVVLSTQDNIYSSSQMCSFSVALLFKDQCPLKFITLNC